MNPRLRILVGTAVIGLAAALLPAAAFSQEAVECPTVETPELAFDAPVFIDRNRAGGEPVSVVAQDGSISVSAHAGTTHVYKGVNAVGGEGDFLLGYFNQTLNWRSTDGGKTWKYVGQFDTETGPHSLTSTGFSDPDFTIDAGGRIYNTEIDLANVAVFSSNDDGQTYHLAHPEVTSGDRPWLTGGDKDEVFLYVNTGKQIWRSTTAGITWELQSLGNSSGPKAKMYNNPLNFATGLVGPNGSSGLALSDDEGKTWTSYPGGDLGPSVDFFGGMAVDGAGYAYRGAAGGYAGPSDTNPNGKVTFNYFDLRTRRWGDVVEIPTPVGDALWPWVVAGDDGRAAMVWYQSLAGKPNEFHIYAAYTTNAHGTEVTCSDGSTRFIEPQFSVADASGRPIHVGKICLSGTTCNLTTGDGGDRRLGDFFTVNIDLEGRLFIASGDTTLPSPTNGPKIVGNPIFIKQTTGAMLRTAPVAPKPSRPLCVVVPTCW